MNKLTTLNGGLYTWSVHEANMCKPEVSLLRGYSQGEKKKKSMKIMSQERIEKITQEKS